MKRLVFAGLLVALIAFAATASYAAQHGRMDLKVGDEVYVCSCGKDCPCQAMSKTEAKCPCGKDMVKAKVEKIDGDVAHVTVGGEHREFKMVGKYACACGPDCPCQMISQTAGKCGCGAEMKEVKSN